MGGGVGIILGCKLNKAQFLLRYTESNIECTITTAKGLKSSYKDENFNDIAKEFFEDIREYIRL